MSFRRSLSLRALLASATAAALACGDPSPVGVDLSMPLMQKRGSKTSTGGSGLLICGQSYDSVTKVFGPSGDTLAVGPHILAVDARALTDTVRITAVAPADTVRWLRLQPDGLVFQTGLHGFPAAVYTSYKDCGVPSGETLRIAQVTDALGIMEYLDTHVQSKKVPWSQANQFAAGVLDHFSNYAIAW